MISDHNLNMENSELNKECCSQSFNWFSNPRSYLFGVIASFAIVGVYLGMNTHSEELSQDLLAVVTLKDNKGREYQATNWKGSPPGGHHLSGVLEFPALDGNPESITLVIRLIADGPDRTFKWPVKR
jgi:hypothetical protein